MSRVCSTQPRPAMGLPVFNGLPTPRSPFRRPWRPPPWSEPRRDHGDERLVLNEEDTTGLSTDVGPLAQVQIVRKCTVSLLGQRLQGCGRGGRAGSPLQNSATLRRAADVDCDRHFRRKTSVQESAGGRTRHNPDADRKAAFRQKLPIIRVQGRFAEAYPALTREPKRPDQKAPSI